MSRRRSRTPLLRFIPLQRSLAAPRLSGAAGRRTVPLRRSPGIRRRRGRGPGFHRRMRGSPLRFSRFCESRRMRQSPPARARRRLTGHASPLSGLIGDVPLPVRCGLRGLAGTRAPGGAPEVRPFAVLFLSAGEDAFPHPRTHLPLSERPPRHAVFWSRDRPSVSQTILPPLVRADDGRSRTLKLGFWAFSRRAIRAWRACHLASGRYCRGLGLFQVFGHDRCASRRRSTPPRPSASGALGPLLSARGVVGERKDTSHAAAAGHIRRPPALQRLHGADA